MAKLNVASVLVRPVEIKRLGSLQVFSAFVSSQRHLEDPRGFFDYWRLRLDFTMGLSPIVNEHEINILCWSSLEALSQSWANTSGHSQCGSYRKQKRRIFDAFLAAHGGPVFSLVSLPDLWARCECILNETRASEERKSFQPTLELCTFLRNYYWSFPSVLEEHQTRQISMDRTFCQIYNDLSCQFTSLPNEELCAWISRSRYGSIAYKIMRCPFIHEGRRGDHSHGFALHLSETQPTYLSHVFSMNPRLGFGPVFIVNLVGDCIRSFEAEIASQAGQAS